ncbi:MAG: hypothetical protein LBB08_01475 [Rickettsiales bacterium]|jgi:hypothetical protein|nr:hypothetical protein [Rickettsiales bacterium]
MQGIYQRLLPHLAIARWSDADTESIVADLSLAAGRGLRAMSAAGAAASVAAALAPSSVKIYQFSTDGAPSPGMSAQIWRNPGGAVSDGSISACRLEDIEHLDWGPILRSKSACGGFLFMDCGAKYLHRLFDFLNLLGDFNGEIHYCGQTNDASMLESARRLVEKIRPDLLENFLIFVTAGFFKNS